MNRRALITLNTDLDQFNRRFFNRVLTQGVGFDSLFEALHNEFQTCETKYPPYNVRQIDEGKYAIEFAVAGFKKSEINVTHNKERGILVVEGIKEDKEEDNNYVHKGIASRSFRQIIPLAEHIEVDSAGLEDGMLVVTLQKTIPEHLQPRQITIK